MIKLGQVESKQTCCTQCGAKIVEDSEHEIFNFIIKNDSIMDKPSREKIQKNLIEKSIFLISSQNIYFAEKDTVSPDGIKLRDSIFKLDILRDPNSLIDLLDGNMIGFIHLRAKIMNKEMFSTFSKLKTKIFGIAVAGIIPFLDLVPAHFVRNNLKDDLLNKFGISKIKQLIQNDGWRRNPLFSEIKVQKIQKIIEAIENDQKIRDIDNFFRVSLNENIDNSSRNLIIDKLIKLLAGIGIAANHLWDDVARFVPAFVANVPAKALAVAGVVAFPVSVLVIYFLTLRAFKKIVGFIEIYSLLIHNIIHEEERSEIL